MIPFNRPYLTGRELDCIREAHANGHLSGDGPFTRRCQDWLQRRIGAKKALLVHSGTAGLEMAAMLSGISPGDEVIMPSYTFVSTANAFVLRGGTPVFVDMRADTLNLDPERVAAAITPKTKAIVPVHYAGVGCDMDALSQIARRYGVMLIEDAAQGILCRYKGKPLGSMGHMAALSFHETKNVISGEGGALLINDPSLVERAEIVREKGTNRKKYFRGEVDRYTWVDIGSSYLPSEISAAFLWAQLEKADEITERRRSIWRRYHEAFAVLESADLLRRPVVPDACEHNAHMYQVVLPPRLSREDFIGGMRARGIQTVFHYVPLHASPAGKIYGRTSGMLINTDSISSRVVRLPLWLGVEEYQDRIIEAVIAELRGAKSAT